MLTRPIPSSGEPIPVIGLGTWQAFDLRPGDPDWAQAGEALQTFADGGGRLVDSSPMYGRAEAAIGSIAAERHLRPKLFLATKVWTQGREAGVRQMQDSLRLLRSPMIDLMQVHNLVDLDAHLPTLETWKADG
jgi:diketogulonate reductase-like aldo/keto reductase